MIKKGRARRTILLYLALVIIGFLVLMPVIWTFITSIKTQKDVITSPVRYIPRPVTWENYKEILISFKPGVLRTTVGSAGGVMHVDFARCFFNSIIVTITSSVLGVVIACLAAYGFSRYDFKGKTLVGFILILTQLIPGVVYIFPIYLTYTKLNLLNNNMSLAIAYMSFILPFGIWMLRGYFISIPRELEEAAMIDGCSSLGIAFRIVFPLAKPAIVAIWIIALIFACRGHCLEGFLICFYFKQEESHPGYRNLQVDRSNRGSHFVARPECNGDYGHAAYNSSISGYTKVLRKRYDCGSNKNVGFPAHNKVEGKFF
ncbi:hypothetical protein ES703_66380 [subsurface metagenome]